MISLLSPEGLSLPLRTAFLSMRMSVCQHLRWPDVVPKSDREAWSTFVKLYSVLYSAIPLWVCVSDTHAELFLQNSLWVQFSYPYAHCAQVLLSLQLPAQLGGHLGRLGHLQLCTCHYWGLFPAIPSTDEAPSLPTLNITTALPKALLFILTVCLRQYYC